MEIVNIELAVYCENDSTVIVTVLNKHNKKMNIHVQTTDGLYRKDLGCIIYDDNGADLNENDFNDYKNDIKKIIEEAEKLISSMYKIEIIDGSVDYVFKIFADKVTLSKVNRQFINADTSSYQAEYEDIKTFDTIKEAKDYFKSILEDK